MGYRVDYQPAMKLRRQQKKGSRAAVLTGLFFLLFLLTVTSIWPRGKEVLQGLLFSGDVAVTAAALENMASDLQAGVPFGNALEEFCIHVIQESERANG